MIARLFLYIFLSMLAKMCNKHHMSGHGTLVTTLGDDIVICTDPLGPAACADVCMAPISAVHGGSDLG